MTVKTEDFRGDIYKNDKNAELRCSPEPILYIWDTDKRWIMSTSTIRLRLAKIHRKTQNATPSIIAVES